MNPLETCFRAVLATSCIGSLLIATLWGLRTVVGRRWWPAALFCGWVLVFLRLALPVSLPSPAQISSHVPALNVIDQASTWIANHSGVAPASAISVRSASSSPSIMLALVWLAGAVVLLCVRALLLCRAMRGVQTSEAALPEEVSMIASLAAEIGVAVPKIRRSADVTLPCLLLSMRPTLLLPASPSKSLPLEQWRNVIRHELFHLKGHHLAASELLYLGCVIHWFNPLVWIARGLAQADCEIACDAAVLADADDDTKSAYGLTLLRLSTGSPGNSSSSFPRLGIASSRRTLRDRICAVAVFDQPSRLRRTGGFVTNAAVGLFAVVTMAASADTVGAPADTPPNAPVADPQPSPEKASRVFHISLERDGTYSMEGKPQSLDQLRVLLDQLENKADVSVQITADRLAPFEHVATLCNHLRTQGITRLIFTANAGAAPTEKNTPYPQEYKLVARGPVRVRVTGLKIDGPLIFEGSLAAGESHTLRRDQLHHYLVDAPDNLLIVIGGRRYPARDYRGNPMREFTVQGP